MRTRFILFAVLFVVSILPSRAQYDANSFNQWLFNMQVDAYVQQQKIVNDFLQTVNAEAERQRANAKATCVVLPSGNDKFYAYITFVNIGINDMEIAVLDQNRECTTLYSDDYVCYNGNVVTGAILEPGMSIVVSDKVKNTFFESVTIPRKGSAAYSEFVNQGAQMQQTINAMLGGGASGNDYQPYNNSQSGRSRGSIQYDLEKAYRLLNDMERNRSNATSTVTQIQYDRMIQNQKNTINRLEQELNSAY